MALSAADACLLDAPWPLVAGMGTEGFPLPPLLEPRGVGAGCCCWLEEAEMLLLLPWCGGGLGPQASWSEDCLVTPAALRACAWPMAAAEGSG